MSELDTKMDESPKNHPKLSDEKELLANLDRVESQNKDKPTEIPLNSKINAGFVCSERILDVLEDKPYILVDYLFLLAKKATPAEKREVQELFPVNADDKKISRPVIKAYIEEWVNSNPQYGKFFSDENVLFIRMGAREFEINSALKIIREKNAAKEKSGGN